MTKDHGKRSTVDKDKSGSSFHRLNQVNFQDTGSSLSQQTRQRTAPTSNTFTGIIKDRLALPLQALFDRSSPSYFQDEMASSLFHPSNPAGTGKGYNGFILDPNRLLAMCGSELHSITIGGDVHLVLENGRIPAQSDVLTCASPVFKAILDPNFSEGQAPRSTRNPKIIPLEDYDIESMTIICILLHKNLSTVHLNTSEKLAETTDPTRILGVAVLADKYALVDHLENELGLKLLAPFTRKHEARKLDLSQALHLVATAYLLQRSELFSLFARRLTIDYGGRSTLLDSDDLFEHIPASSINKLKVQLRLTKDLALTTNSSHRGPTQLRTSTNQCSCRLRVSKNMLHVWHREVRLQLRRHNRSTPRAQERPLAAGPR